MGLISWIFDRIPKLRMFLYSKGVISISFIISATNFFCLVSGKPIPGINGRYKFFLFVFFGFIFLVTFVKRFMREMKMKEELDAIDKRMFLSYEEKQKRKAEIRERYGLGNGCLL